jgi:hypothetical protein
VNCVIGIPTSLCCTKEIPCCQAEPLAPMIMGMTAGALSASLNHTTHCKYQTVPQRCRQGPTLPIQHEGCGHPPCHLSIYGQVWGAHSHFMEPDSNSTNHSPLCPTDSCLTGSYNLQNPKGILHKPLASAPRTQPPPMAIVIPPPHTMHCRVILADRFMRSHPHQRGLPYTVCC